MLESCSEITHLPAGSVEEFAPCSICEDTFPATGEPKWFVDNGQFYHKTRACSLVVDIPGTRLNRRNNCKVCIARPTRPVNSEPEVPRERTEAGSASAAASSEAPQGTAGQPPVMPDLYVTGLKTTVPGSQVYHLNRRCNKLNHLPEFAIRHYGMCLNCQRHLPGTPDVFVMLGGKKYHLDRQCRSIQHATPDRVYELHNCPDCRRGDKDD